MSGIVNLLPTSVAVSGDGSIGYILSDIPLFCEGIMGIGIFTFLVLVKQIRLPSIFLYGSTLLAFTAATFDLGQNLARRPKKTENDISLDTIWGILYAREILFAFSIGFLELFFWKLVACCPVEETDMSDFDIGPKSRKHCHSANWNRWGLFGMLLKWTSLAASLSVPLLQVLWRLLPNQRQYGSIYVAATIVETALAAVFILKLVLNICISPNQWWYAVQSYVVPMFAISVEIGLGIANFVVFAFTETTLGRLLRGVEVYFLILHNLHNVFRIYRNVPRQNENTFMNPEYKPKSRDGSILPISYPGPASASSPKDFTNIRFKLTRQIDVKSRASKLSWPFPSKHFNDVLQGGQYLSGDREEKASSSPAPRTNDNRESGHAGMRHFSGYGQQSTSFLVLGSPTDLLSSRRDALDRPATSPEIERQGTQPQAGVSEVDAGNAKTDLGDNFRFPSSSSSSIASQQRGSIEDILCQQVELDNNIARLRLAAQVDIGSSVPLKSRNTLNSNKTASTSNRSEFSLSVFPDPPIRPIEDTNTPEIDIDQKEGPDESIVISPEGSSSPQDQISGPADTSRSNKYDATSAPVTILGANHEGTPMASATSSSVSALKPMILPSMVTPSPQDKVLSVETGSEALHTDEKAGLTSQTLRPLLLGKPLSTVPPLPATKVPLAQRRQRGGTISSNTRRPVISGPLISEERASPGAFERPRPPPLRL